MNRREELWKLLMTTSDLEVRAEQRMRKARTKEVREEWRDNFKRFEARRHEIEAELQKLAEEEKAVAQ